MTFGTLLAFGLFCLLIGAIGAAAAIATLILRAAQHRRRAAHSDDDGEPHDFGRLRW